MSNMQLIQKIAHGPLKSHHPMVVVWDHSVAQNLIRPVPNLKTEAEVAVQKEMALRPAHPFSRRFLGTTMKASSRTKWRGGGVCDS